MAAAERRVAGAHYLFAYLGLVLLATASLCLSMVHWQGGLAVSLAIAMLKAILVLWIFMHLAEQRFSSGLVMLIAALFISLLAGLATADVATRHTFPARPRPPGDEAFYRN
jgi:caa(3)-type oxidase subunit IV